jgi:hypothetical protein
LGGGRVVDLSSAIDHGILVGLKHDSTDTVIIRRLAKIDIETRWSPTNLLIIVTVVVIIVTVSRSYR